MFSRCRTRLRSDWQAQRVINPYQCDTAGVAAIAYAVCRHSITGCSPFIDCFGAESFIARKCWCFMQESLWRKVCSAAIAATLRTECIRTDGGQTKICV